MIGSDCAKPELENRQWLRRKPLALDGEQAAPALPLVFRASDPRHELGPWLKEMKHEIGKALEASGAVLLRGFRPRGSQKLEAIVRDFSGEPLEYVERSSPRTALHGRVYSSTEYPPDQEIGLHNENSYAAVFPALIFFQCETPAARGGQTPLADCRRVLARLPPDVVERFTAHGVRYVRTFMEGVGLPWQTVFGTSRREEVERRARDSGYESRWLDAQSLQTIRIGPAVLRQKSGERSWFNHAAFFHVSSLPPLVARGLLDQLGEARLPAQTYFGDGSSIEPETLELVRAAYRDEARTFDWAEGDLLVVDNLAVAHGRRPFEGRQRRIAVAMAQPCAAVTDTDSGAHRARALS